MIAERSGILRTAPPGGPLDGAEPGVSLSYWLLRQPGDHVTVTHSNRDYLGVITATGSDRARVERSVGAARGRTSGTSGDRGGAGRGGARPGRGRGHRGRPLAFGGPGKTPAELAAALELASAPGAGTTRFHVESPHELALLDQAARAAPPAHARGQGARPAVRGHRGGRLGAAVAAARGSRRGRDDRRPAVHAQGRAGPAGAGRPAAGSTGSGTWWRSGWPGRTPGTSHTTGSSCIRPLRSIT
jgi:hypothetical protein